ncbi:exosortase-dependent surface protein XDP1 [Sedimenticola hydrogenitrophicus]|uniref:exosortase-dependent surface protein XDP1 n=1 Tax=Sedimenticola hydrogenitrophicus TaxID=2967975 RepID=UPI0021A88466|nr:exosortase-dependent surface protein XDP1 [Sedimenticola hydrogenitrophicus]
MRTNNKIATITLPGILTLLLSGQVMADWSWDFTSAYTGNSSGMSFDGSGGAPDVSVTGWSNANYASGSGSSSYGTGDLVQRNLAQWSGGLGVYSGEDWGSPSHAMDNQYRIDAILLSFGGTAVTLNQVKFGWNDNGGTDTDFSLSAYTGGGSTNLSSMEYADLASSGWTTIGSYYDAGTSVKSVNVGDVSSSYWLISALNPNLGGTSNTNFYGNDFFKLTGAAGIGPSTTTEVPEPSTLLLLGGVLLILSLRSRAANNRQSGYTVQV